MKWNVEMLTSQGLLTPTALRLSPLSAAQRGGGDLQISFLKPLFPHPLSGEAEERVAQRSVGGVSYSKLRKLAMLTATNCKPSRPLTPTALRLSPLSAAQRGGGRWLFDQLSKYPFLNPLSGEAEERVAQRSVGGVSSRRHPRPSSTQTLPS